MNSVFMNTGYFTKGARPPEFRNEQAVRMVRDRRGKPLWAVCTNGWRYEFGEDGNTIVTP
jgi:hypothetical protein